MKRLRKLNKTASTLMLATVVSVGSFTPYLVDAQAADNATRDRIRLMSTALQARDNGDLQAAKSSLEQLIAITPDDPNVQRLLTQVNRDIELKNAGQPTVYGQAAAEQSFDPRGTTETAVEEVVVANEADPIASPASPTRRELIDQADAALDTNNYEVAATIADQYESLYGVDRRLRGLRREISAVRNDPWLQNPEVLSPGFEAEVQTIKSLLVKARAQMLYGDIEGSRATLREVETRDPSNAQAKALQIEILSQQKQTSWLDHRKTRDEMMQDVDRSWQRPQIFERDVIAPPTAVDGAIREKLRRIEIPSVELSNVPLTRAIETLSELSVLYDGTTSDERQKGVNMLAMLGGAANPNVSLKLRHRSLDTILDFLTQQVGFQWDVQNDTVVVQRSGDQDGSYVETEFFPISAATRIRLTGASGDGASSGGGGGSNPFAPAAQTGGGGASASDNENAIRSFFERAGITFQGVPGASLAFDGTQLIATQTPRNLERMRAILRRYDETKQVEIEARFMEVQQGDLNELSFNWAMSSQNGSNLQSFAGSGNRNLASAFGGTNAASRIEITSRNPVTGVADDPVRVPMAPPNMPGNIDLGQGSPSFGFNLGTAAAGSPLAGLAGMAGVSGIIGNFELGLAIDALERKTGSDLLSSPKVTVLSGRTAKIVVAQELRYPESYGDIQSEVGTGNSAGGGSSGVTITAGTPQDFTVRNVGVEMEVTPTVEENQNISLKLEPTVTEFEGFVEYGGTSVAVASGTTVTVPSGFYQPIFSVRSVRTEVTVFDGATVVLGGLTREEVKTIDDRIPVLGDIPLVGRLFQSKGETRTKKNLLIFVTANLISPGGSPAKQSLSNVEANSLFQNPTIVTPTGGVNRTASGGSSR